MYVSYLLTLATERPYMDGTCSNLQWKDACAIREGYSPRLFDVFLMIYFQNRHAEHDKNIIPFAMHPLVCRQTAAFNKREIWRVRAKCVLRARCPHQVHT